MKNLKILALGDITGPRSVEYLKKNLWKIRKLHSADFVVANGENASEPNGIDRQTAEVLFDSGVDVITQATTSGARQGFSPILTTRARFCAP